MKPIQWPYLASAMQTLLGLKGRVILKADEMVIPTVLAADASEAPFGETRIPAGNQRTTAAAGVGRFGGAHLAPNENVVLKVKSVMFTNETGAASAYEVRWLTAAQVAAVTAVGAFTMLAHNSRDRNAFNETASLLTTFHHNLIVGQTLARVWVPDQDQREVQLPDGFCLWGLDQNAGALAGWIDTANVEARMAWLVNEYKLTG